MKYNINSFLFFCRSNFRDKSQTNIEKMSVLANETSEEWLIHTLGQKDGRTWIFAAICSALVGLSGLFPVLLLPCDENANVKSDEKSKKANFEPKNMRFLLSFAVGSLLGDVFLHLLPEAFSHLRHSVEKGLVNAHTGQMQIGLWILIGLLTFVIVEMIFSLEKDNKESGIQVSGYLNLVANCIDNFSHGLAVGGGFLVSNKMGFITTCCILMHEVPHEVGDFAILMKSGFSRYEAAKAQFWTASLGISGAMAAVILDSCFFADVVTTWVIPFTGGGFLNIALVTVLPDLLKETKTIRDFFVSSAGMLLGLSIMAIMSQL